jgi:uncharacterized protein YjaZ
VYVFFDSLVGLIFLESQKEHMRIIDLTEEYIQHVIQEDQIDNYEANFPQLFEHYYTFWAQPQKYLFRDVQEIVFRRNLVLAHLPWLVERFERKKLHITDVDVVVFVGHGTSNGHAFPSKEDHWVVWLPLEAYSSPQIVDVFVAHEIAHALHYQLQPAFYFRDVQEKNQVFRQLVTEGIATLTSKEVLNISNKQALWADYLPRERIERWYKACLEREDELFCFVADKLESSDEQNGLFSFSDTDEILENRAGYYAGLVLVERYVRQQGLTLQDLFRTSKEEFWHIMRSSLKIESA